MSSQDLLRRIERAMANDEALRSNSELIRWAALLPHVDRNKPHLVDAAGFAIRLVVLRGAPRSLRDRFDLWRLRRSVERHTQTRCPAFYLVRGLAVLTGCAIPVVSLIWWVAVAKAQQFGLESAHLGLVALAGVIGSVVSVLTRVPEFCEKRDVSRFVLEAIGFCKPLIGTAFALFAYVLLRSDIIPLTLDAANPAVLAALGFVAAFSERFIPDMIFRTERRLGGGRRQRERRPD